MHWVEVRAPMHKVKVIAILVLDLRQLICRCPSTPTGMLLPGKRSGIFSSWTHWLVLGDVPEAIRVLFQVVLHPSAACLKADLQGL